jgi:hypothetical protein
LDISPPQHLSVALRLMPLHPLPQLSDAVVEGTENQVSFLPVKGTATKYTAIVD